MKLILEAAGFAGRSHPQNLEVILSTDARTIIKSLPQGGAHFTNGTYAYPADLILRTTLVGFDYVNSQKTLPMVIAVNSDRSMVALGKSDCEPQVMRAEKVAIPLAKAFPNTPVFVLFYDETTPLKLYETLATHQLTKTLHKWGYGTEPSAPKIEGAECFESVYAFPLPNDIKPVCYSDTSLPTEKQAITVVDLRDKFKPAEAQGIFSQARQFAREHPYTLFAAGAAVLAASIYTALSNSTENISDTTYTP